MSFRRVKWGEEGNERCTVEGEAIGRDRLDEGESRTRCAKEKEVEEGGGKEDRRCCLTTGLSTLLIFHYSLSETTNSAPERFPFIVTRRE